MLGGRSRPPPSYRTSRGCRCPGRCRSRRGRDAGRRPWGARRSAALGPSAQVAEPVRGISPAPRQTASKRTQRHSVALTITCRYSSPARHAQEGTRRHRRVSVSTPGAAFARRRSGVRLPCGPPLICRAIVSFLPSDSLPVWPCATPLQPKSVCGRWGLAQIRTSAVPRAHRCRGPRKRSRHARGQRDGPTPAPRAAPAVAAIVTEHHFTYSAFPALSAE